MIGDYGLGVIMVYDLSVVTLGPSKQRTHLCKSLCAINLLQSPSVESSVANQDVYRDYLADFDSVVGS